MRVQLFDAIDRIAPAYLIGRETGDVMNIAVSDIETLEFFFAHTIGPMFTGDDGGAGLLRQSALRLGADSHLSDDQRGSALRSAESGPGHRYALPGAAGRIEIQNSGECLQHP